MGSVRKIGYITVGVSLMLIGLAYLLRDTAAGFLWNASILGAVILITLGIEIIAMKIAADRTPGVVVRGSAFSIVIISLTLVALLFTSLFSNVFGRIANTSRNIRDRIGIESGGSFWSYNLNPSNYNSSDSSFEPGMDMIDGGALTIDARAADIEIIQTKDDFRVDAKFYVHRNYGRDDAEIIDALVDVSGQMLKIHANIDDRVNLGKVTVYVPEEVNNLTVESGAVRFSAAGFKGDIILHSSFGDIDLRGIDGNVDISQSAANVIVEDITGSLTSKGGVSLGELKAYNIGGDIDIALDAGNAVINNVDGNVRCKVEMGNMELRDVAGEIRAEASAGNISIYGNCAGITGMVNMGNLEWRNFDAGNVKIEAIARFGTITASRSLGSSSRQMTSDRLSVSFGDGSIYADLNADMGNITIYP